MVSKRKSYNREFKIETVKLVTDGDARVPEIARDMGIHPNTLYNWIQQFSAKPEEAFPARGTWLPMPKSSVSSSVRMSA